jgi:hypothetical protein
MGLINSKFKIQNSKLRNFGTWGIGHGNDKIFKILLWDGHLARPLYSLGGQDAHPTRWIILF